MPLSVLLTIIGLMILFSIMIILLIVAIAMMGSLNNKDFNAVATNMEKTIENAHFMVKTLHTGKIIMEVVSKKSKSTIHITCIKFVLRVCDFFIKRRRLRKQQEYFLD